MNQSKLEINVVTFDFDKSKEGKPWETFLFKYLDHKIYFRRIGEYILPTMSDCKISLIRNEEEIDYCLINWLGNHGESPQFKVLDQDNFFGSLLRYTENHLSPLRVEGIDSFKEGDIISISIEHSHLTQEEYAQQFFLKQIS